jgi:hypothetical protein
MNWRPAFPSDSLTVASCLLSSAKVKFLALVLLVSPELALEAVFCPFLLKLAGRDLATNARPGQSHKGFPSRSALGGRPRSNGSFAAAALLCSSSRSFLRNLLRVGVSSDVRTIGGLVNLHLRHGRASLRAWSRCSVGGSSGSCLRGL